MAQLTYAHCTHATAGKGDVAPFTRYETRSVEFVMYRVGPHPMIQDDEDSFDVEVDGEIVGSGDTKEEAIGDARYRLMDKSRSAAYAAAEERALASQGASA